MFGHRFFGARYFAPRYFGPAVAVVLPPEPPVEPGVGGAVFTRPRPRPVPRPELVIAVESRQAAQVSAAVCAAALTAQLLSLQGSQDSAADGDVSIDADARSSQVQGSKGYAWSSIGMRSQSHQAGQDGMAEGDIVTDVVIRSGRVPREKTPTYVGKPMPSIFMTEH